jgi:hypothetical protein
MKKSNFIDVIENNGMIIIEFDKQILESERKKNANIIV